MPEVLLRMEKMRELFGIGNALVDVITSVPDSFLTQHAFEKSTMRLVGDEEQRQLLSALAGVPKRLISGGSVGNSIFLYGQLGGSAHFGCLLSDDELGNHYFREFQENSVGIDIPQNGGATAVSTGSSVVMITPDAERTMRTHLGVTLEARLDNFSLEILPQAKTLFLEGYFLTNSEHCRDIAREAIRLCKEHGVQVALTLSEAWVVETQGDLLSEILPQVDILFANEQEALALARVSDSEQAFAILKEKVSVLAMTRGEKPVLLSAGGMSCSVPTVNCTPKDLTGAGDAFAGAFLYAFLRGPPLEQTGPLEQVGALACAMAAEVIQKIGARLSAEEIRLQIEALTK